MKHRFDTAVADCMQRARKYQHGTTGLTPTWVRMARALQRGIVRRKIRAHVKPDEISYLYSHERIARILSTAR